MTKLSELLTAVPQFKQKKTWIVTGGAGFIGSHIADNLMALGQVVKVIDNLSTGKESNISYLKTRLVEYNSNNIPAEFTFHKGSICDLDFLKEVIPGADYIIHQGALGSVPRSIGEPLNYHASNATGFVNIIESARINKIERVVYASSSSVYGDSPGLPKVEDKVGKVLSPYAATKMIDEIYADAYTKCYDMTLVGLRYFNVFGARQDPEGAYAAVIPKWIDAIKRGVECEIYGDGETSRDFCYVDNVVFANIMGALTDFGSDRHQVFNVACGERTSLKELYNIIGEQVVELGFAGEYKDPVYKPFRPGDIKHSLADISRISDKLNYKPLVFLRDGLKVTINYFLSEKS